MAMKAGSDTTNLQYSIVNIQFRLVRVRISRLTSYQYKSEHKNRRAKSGYNLKPIYLQKDILSIMEKMIMFKKNTHLNLD